MMKNMSRFLLKYKADPNKGIINKEETPLICAVYNQNERIVAMLLDHGADPNLESHRLTPLVTAVEMGNFRLTKLLLTRGANPNQPGKPSKIDTRECQYIVPLVAIPMTKNCTKLAKLLLDHKADVKIRSPQGYDILTLVLFANNSSSYNEYIEPFLHLLVEYGCPFDAKHFLEIINDIGTGTKEAVQHFMKKREKNQVLQSLAEVVTRGKNTKHIRRDWAYDRNVMRQIADLVVQ